MRKGRAATHLGALLLAIMLMHTSVRVLAGKVKPSGVGRARDMATRSTRSCSGLGFGMMTKPGIGMGMSLLGLRIARLCSLKTSDDTPTTRHVCMSRECVR